MKDTDRQLILQTVEQALDNEIKFYQGHGMFIEALRKIGEKALVMKDLYELSN